MPRFVNIVRSWGKHLTDSYPRRLKGLKNYQIIKETTGSVELEYSVPLFAVPIDSLKAKLTLPKSFYNIRREWIQVKPKITNHDYLAFHCFCKLLEKLEQPRISVLEFGTFNGIFLQNLADYAQNIGVNLDVTVVDSFDVFPDTLSGLDFGRLTSLQLKKRMELTKPMSGQRLVEILSSYKSVNGVKIIETNILDLPTDSKMSADIIHIDTDTYASVKHALGLIDLDKVQYLMVDDYYQPSWTGVINAVNEICCSSHLAPVNLADYLGVPRSLRICFIYLLVRVKTGKF